jgi:ABC-type cobalamin transport system ATPase subunit
LLTELPSKKQSKAQAKEPLSGYQENAIKPKARKALLSLHDIKWDSRISCYSMTIHAGDYLHVIGSNGAGKSSLLSLLSGLDSPDTGQVYLENALISEHSLLSLSKTRCFLAQQQSTEFDISVAQLLSFYTPESTYIMEQGQKSGQNSQSTLIPNELDDYLSLNAMLHRPLSTLSGGQQKRFHIARVLLQVWPAILRGEAIIILDEPLAQLDINYQRRVLRLLEQLSNKGNTIIMSCHDINLSAQFASTVALLKGTDVVKYGPVKDLINAENLSLIFDCEFNQEKYWVSR